MKNKIKAEIVADSISEQGHRITSYILTYPRIIHAEVMTHRMFSRNAASSRAIPFKKMVKMVEEDPFIPIAWQKDHKGMQGTEYFTDAEEIKNIERNYLFSRDEAVARAKVLNSKGVTKQICNRLLEPFMWHTVLVTATEWSNFFELRCPKYHSPVDIHFLHKSKKDCIAAHSNPDNLKIFNEFSIEDWLAIDESQAEIHIQALAEAMWDAMNESTPNKLETGEWHMPFMGNFDPKKLLELSGQEPEDFELVCRKIATARCARLSYMTFDGDIDYQKDIELHDTLLESQHASPFEHCCRVLTKEEYNILGKTVLHPENEWVFENGWVDNFKGFISYRRILNI